MAENEILDIRWHARWAKLRQLVELQAPIEDQADELIRVLKGRLNRCKPGDVDKVLTACERGDRDLLRGMELETSGPIKEIAKIAHSLERAGATRYCSRRDLVSTIIRQLTGQAIHQIESLFIRDSSSLYKQRADIAYLQTQMFGAEMSLRNLLDPAVPRRRDPQSRKARGVPLSRPLTRPEPATPSTGAANGRR